MASGGLLTAIEALMAEHRVIEGLLALLDRVAGDLERGGAVSSAGLGELIDVLQQYTEAHHTREERRLFIIVIERGLEPQNAVHALIDHHETGRAQWRSMRSEVDRIEQGDPHATVGVAVAAHAYVDLMRAHIRAEDEAVFPLVAKALRPDEDERLAAFFAESNRGQLAEDLQAKCARLLARGAGLASVE